MTETEIMFKNEIRCAFQTCNVIKLEHHTDNPSSTNTKRRIHKNVQPDKAGCEKFQGPWSKGPREILKILKNVPSTM